MKTQLTTRLKNEEVTVKVVTEVRGMEDTRMELEYYPAETVTMAIAELSNMVEEVENDNNKIAEVVKFWLKNVW